MEEQRLSKWIKKTILEDFKTNNKKGLYATTQKLMAYNSNRMEGSTLTSEQTASLFDTGTIVSNGIEVYRAKDIEEMNGHFKMFNQMLKCLEEPLTINLIKSYHYQLKNGVFEDLANGYPVGEFKNRANRVSDLQTAKPSEVQEQLELLLKQYNTSKGFLESLAKFHAGYESIHPFQDGNGRTGRMIIVKQCFDNSLIPVIVKDSRKLEYYHVLHAAQVEENYKGLEDFFRSCQKEYLEEIQDFIEDFERESGQTMQSF